MTFKDYLKFLLLCIAGFLFIWAFAYFSLVGLIRYKMHQRGIDPNQEVIIVLTYP